MRNLRLPCPMTRGSRLPASRRRGVVAGPRRAHPLRALSWVPLSGRFAPPGAAHAPDRSLMLSFSAWRRPPAWHPARSVPRWRGRISRRPIAAGTPAEPMSQTHRPYRGSHSGTHLAPGAFRHDLGDLRPDSVPDCGESRGVAGPRVAAGHGGGLTPDDARTNRDFHRTGSPVAVRDRGRRGVRRRIFGARHRPDRAHRHFPAVCPCAGEAAVFRVAPGNGLRLPVRS